jgi:hypothetical protein
MRGMWWRWTLGAAATRTRCVAEREVQRVRHGRVAAASPAADGACRELSRAACWQSPHAHTPQREELELGGPDVPPARSAAAAGRRLASARPLAHACPAPHKPSRMHERTAALRRREITLLQLAAASALLPGTAPGPSGAVPGAGAAPQKAASRRRRRCRGRANQHAEGVRQRCPMWMLAR